MLINSATTACIDRIQYLSGDTLALWSDIYNAGEAVRLLGDGVRSLCVIRRVSTISFDLDNDLRRRRGGVQQTGVRAVGLVSELIRSSSRSSLSTLSLLVMSTDMDPAAWYAVGSWLTAAGDAGRWLAAVVLGVELCRSGADNRRADDDDGSWSRCAEPASVMSSQLEHCTAEFAAHTRTRARAHTHTHTHRQL